MISTQVEGYAFATDPCGEGLCADQDLGELAKTIQATPAAVCVNAGAWDDYTGGVLRYDACSGAYADIDHCVQLVGYDATGEEPYWIVRNSWSTSWGEDGYIRLQMDANTCGVADEATVAMPRDVAVLRLSPSHSRSRRRDLKTPLDASNRWRRGAYGASWPSRCSAPRPRSR